MQIAVDVLICFCFLVGHFVFRLMSAILFVWIRDDLYLLEYKGSSEKRSESFNTRQRENCRRAATASGKDNNIDEDIDDDEDIVDDDNINDDNDKWKMTGDRWQVTDDKWQVTSDRWQVTGDWWQVTGDWWQVTGDRWQVTGDKWQVIRYGLDNWTMYLGWEWEFGWKAQRFIFYNGKWSHKSPD